MTLSLFPILNSGWIGDVEHISGKQTADIRHYLLTGLHTPNDPFSQGGAALYFTDRDVVNGCYASDINRFASASFETIQGIHKDQRLPKSLSWPLIRLYYAAFFSAHALIRLHGRSLTQLDGVLCTRLNHIAIAYGTFNESPLLKGLYRIVLNQSVMRIELKKATENSHEALWLNFGETLKPVAQRLLSNAITSEEQDFSLKLVDLLSVLSDGGRMPNYNWLSYMRNSINYRQEHSVWHPYVTQPKYYSGLNDIINRWVSHPNDLTFWPDSDRNVQRFVESCVFIVSLCRQCCDEIGKNSPGRRSFLKYKALSIVNLVS